METFRKRLRADAVQPWRGGECIDTKLEPCWWEDDDGEDGAPSAGRDMEEDGQVWESYEDWDYHDGGLEGSLE